jgi:GNAT superfamily N-acetyltransferase
MTANASDLTVRCFCARDLDDLWALVCETVETSYAAVYPPRVVEFFLEYHERSKILSDSANGLTLVVLSADDLIATGTCVGTTARRVFVRGDLQRRGIGKLIMAELEADALARGVTRLDLSASLPAKDFYLGLGYGVVSEEDYEVAPGQHLEYYEMAKTLTDR